MAQVKFFTATKAKYEALETKDENALYIVTDAGAIYKGSHNVTSDVSVAEVVPQALTEGKVQFVKVTAGSKVMYDVYVGGKGNTVIKAMPGSVDDKAAFGDAATFGAYVPTVAAVKGFVEDSLKNVTANANKALIDATYDNGTLTFNHADGSAASTATLTGVAHDISWDPNAYKLTVKNFGAEDVEINIPKDFFLQDGKFEPEHKFTPATGDPYTSPAIVLTVNIQNGETATAKEIAIPVKDLVDTYTVGSTDTVTLSMDAKHNITAAVKVAGGADTDKILVKTAKGLGQATKSVSEIEADITSAVNAAKTELAGKMVGDGAADKVVVSTANGVKRSTMVLGGEALAAAPNATTVATEKAVKDAFTAADSALHTAVTGEISTAKKAAIDAAAADAATKASAAQAAAEKTAETKANAAQAAAEKTAADALAAYTKTNSTALSGKADKATTLAGYGIADAYTKSATDTAIATAVAGAHHLKREIVAALPEVATANEDTIYMVPNTGKTDAAGSAASVYTEYMLINGAFERIGTSDADLTAYAKTADVNKAIADAKSATATDAATKAATAKTEAIAAAKTETTSQVSAAKTAAAEDATSKANTAKSEAIAAAKTDAASQIATALTWNEL